MGDIRALLTRRARTGCCSTRNWTGPSPASPPGRARTSARPPRWVREPCRRGGDIRHDTRPHGGDEGRDLVRRAARTPRQLGRGERRLECGWSGARARSQWNALLGRIAVTGGTSPQQQTFYSALYHSFVHPNVFSDANGAYPGFDGRVHTARGYTQYANFSGWTSTARKCSCRAPRAGGDGRHDAFVALGLRAERFPAQVGVRRLRQRGDQRRLRRPDPGGRLCVRRAELRCTRGTRAMVHGANSVGTGLGWDVARQDNDQYLARGWVQEDRHDKTSFDYTIGGSETLEYAIDDAAIAKLAVALDAHDIAATFTARGATGTTCSTPRPGTWRRGEPTGASRRARRSSGRRGRASGRTAGRRATQFNTRGACRRTCAASSTRWAETARWSASSTASSLISTRVASSPSRGPGTSPPSEYLGSTTTRACRGARKTSFAASRTDLYAATPNGEPGNDDLGAMSSWYVWAAIGMYPETPGSADLARASPMFTHVLIRLANGRILSIDVPDRVDPESLRENVARQRCARAVRCAGPEWRCPWLPASAIRRGLS